MTITVRDKTAYHQQTTERMSKFLDQPAWSVRQKLALALRGEVPRGNPEERLGGARRERRRHPAAEAQAPLTRGRVHEALALFAWKGQELEAAADHLRHAHAAYADGCPPAALARVLAKEAGVLRDCGRMDEALVVQDRRLQAASAVPDVPVLKISGPTTQRPVVVFQ